MRIQNSPCMAPKAVTFRVRRIPAGQTTSSVAGFLHGSVDGLGNEENVIVRSLAVSPFDWSSRPTQVATVEFGEIPSRFLDGQKEWTIYLGRSSQFLLFDLHFSGFTPVNEVDPDKHEYDFLAVSGLGSHPFGSWRQRNNAAPQQFMWLRDQLSHDFPTARIMIYGYDTELDSSDSHQTIDDLARTLVQHLTLIGRADYWAKPCVIFAHSLGGILVKRALYYLAGSGDYQDFVLQKMKLIVFLGVPNRGMKTKHLISMTKSRPNENLIGALSQDSSYLNMLDEGFAGIAALRYMRIVSAYETKRSVTAQMDANGLWKRCGPAEFLVGRESAIQTGSLNPRDIFHIDEDHSNMVKFSPDDANYFIVRRHLENGLSRRQNATTADGREISSSTLSTPTGPFTQLGLDDRFRKERMSSAQQQLVQTRNDPQLSSCPHGPNCTSCNREEDRVSSRPPPYLALSESITFGAEDGLDGMHVSILNRKEVSDDTIGFAELKESLDFAEKDFRYNAIADEEQSTLGWIWKKDLGLKDWILKRQGVYWIQGKPGSGKSTLMKHLHRDKTLRREIESSGHIPLWFFFNERGGHMQKTFEGLLRTLLSELVTKAQTLSLPLLKLFRRTRRDIRHIWDIARLRTAFSAILEQQQQEANLLIFLDALDEYNGFPESIVEWILDLAKPSRGKSLTSVKICFSSRPWSAFVAAFNNEPGFTLQEHTMEDIRGYTEAKMGPLCKLKTTESAREYYWYAVPVRHVIDTLAGMAEGVFLWVRLAVNVLTQQEDCKSIAAFEEVIQKLPVDLEQFYARTLERIPENNRKDAFVLLEIVHRSLQPLTILELCLAAECAVGTTFDQCSRILSLKQRTLSSSMDAHQNLLNMCAGLLECVEVVKEEAPAAYYAPETPLNSENASKTIPYVQYIHRTAKDFVGSPIFAEKLFGPQHKLYLENGFTYMLKFRMALQRGITNPDEDLLILARADERTTGRPASSFLNSVPDEIFATVFKRQMIVTQRDFLDLHNTIFEFAVLADLRLYVTSRLDTKQIIPRAMTRQQPPLHLISWRARRYYYTTQANAERDQFKLHSMFKLLLKHGFDAEEKDKFGISAFDILVTTGIEKGDLDAKSPRFSAVYGLIEVLCKTRAVNINCLIRYRSSGDQTIAATGNAPKEFYLECAMASKYADKSESFKPSQKSTEFSQDLAALHVCNPVTMEIMLQNGANPNVLDAYGHTPMDLLCLLIMEGGLLMKHQGYEKAILLLAKGGRVTMTGARRWYQLRTALTGAAIEIALLPLRPSLVAELESEENLRTLEEDWQKEELKRMNIAAERERRLTAHLHAQTEWATDLRHPSPASGKSSSWYRKIFRSRKKDRDS